MVLIILMNNILDEQAASAAQPEALLANLQTHFVANRTDFRCIHC